MKKLLMTVLMVSAGLVSTSNAATCNQLNSQLSAAWQAYNQAFQNQSTCEVINELGSNISQLQADITNQCPNSNNAGMMSPTVCGDAVQTGPQ